MEYKCLISHLKNKFKKQLETDFKNGSIYSEAELQCILYGELRKFYTFVYPETWYGNNRADLVIFKKSITDIRKNDSKEIKNLSFNIAYYNEKICNTIIELKYGYSSKELVKALINDEKALNHKIDTKKNKVNYWSKNIKNRMLFYILDINTSKNNDINSLKKLNFEGIEIIGYIWDGEKLELINN